MGREEHKSYLPKAYFTLVAGDCAKALNLDH